SKPMAMNLDDFVVDKKALVGKFVAVTGSAYCLGGEICYLSSPNSPMTNIMLSVIDLSRDDRKRLLPCNPFSNPCVVTVTGRATAEMMASIKAEMISFAPNEEDRAASDPSLPPCDKIDSAYVRSLAADSALAKMLHLKIIDMKIEGKSDPEGNTHCVAHILSNAGE